MPDPVRIVPPPKGLSRFLYRLPIQLYRIGLGGLFGSRFLLLRHKGRKTGLPREAVIEIIQQDEGGDRTFVVAAWGERSDWYQNIQAHPRVVICIGRKCREVLARTLPVDEARTLLLNYANRHPTAARSLSRLLGYRIETQADFAELATSMPVVVFESA